MVSQRKKKVAEMFENIILFYRHVIPNEHKHDTVITSGASISARQRHASSKLTNCVVLSNFTGTKTLLVAVTHVEVMTG